jgi:hypothetical protein
MKSWRWNINVFCAAAVIFVFGACKTTEEKKAAKDRTMISLHIEMNPDGSAKNSPVPIYRSQPMRVNVSVQPFLTNVDLDSASVVDLEGGFGIKLAFDPHGTKVLDMYTVAHKGKRIAIDAAFPELRWLAAPLITRRISDGVFIFTPDATKEEAERIVRGLNNTIKQGRKGWLK